ncbi:unnamed protein product [Rotaria socialis]|uniref:Uncharacterized protein n=1 Tax=Rotaria socialis TaxID=392032 RepID=A0A818J258_9BILA|nr:unnamed protein product [Rotaria socialis]CAF3534370.1 unnamed protein product [Rotaria socialis]
MNQDNEYDDVGVNDDAGNDDDDDDVTMEHSKLRERGETVYEAPGGNHLLNTYCHDFIADAEKGKFGYIIGLNQIISECINILLRQTKNSVLLIGAPGVGKKAIVKSLAHRIVHQNVHHDVSKHLFALNMEALTGKA